MSPLFISLHFHWLTLYYRRLHEFNVTEDQFRAADDGRIRDMHNVSVTKCFILMANACAHAVGNKRHLNPFVSLKCTKSMRLRHPNHKPG